MTRNLKPAANAHSTMILGVGAFAQSIGTALADAGADVSTYLTRNYGHYSPSLVGPTYSRDSFSNPCAIIKERGIDFVIPQSIDWAQAPWAGDLMKSGAGIFCPTGEAMRIERERDFARKLCGDFKIPFPRSFVARNRIEAEKVLRRQPRPDRKSTRLNSSHTVLSRMPSSA